MVISDSLSERVRKKYSSLTASQRTLARFCVSDPDRAGTLTAMRIADELGVSESTVVRFAVKLGYKGFPDMQASIRQAVVHHAETSRPSAHGEMDGRAHESLQNDLDALAQSIKALDLTRLSAAVDAVDQANTVHVCGFRTSFSLAYLAMFHIRKIHPSVRLLGDVGGTFVDDLELVSRGDAVLAFTFPVYDDRTIQAIEYATKAGASSVVVTDSALAPIPVSEMVHPLTVRHDSESFFNSNVSATALINAIVVRLVELRTAQDPNFEQRLSESFHGMRGKL